MASRRSMAANCCCWLLLLGFMAATVRASIEDFEITSEDDDPWALTNNDWTSVARSSIYLNSTAALLALLTAAALLTALGFLIYHVSEMRSQCDQTILSYGGGGGYSSGGGSSYGGGGSSYGGGAYGSGGSGGGSYGVGYARSSKGMDWDSLRILDYISMMEEMWRKFDIKDVACQKRVVCEIHQNEAALGPAASRMVNIFGYLRYMTVLNIVPEAMKSAIAEYQEAADKGRSLSNNKQCSEMYDGCEFSIKDTFLKYAAAGDHTGDDQHEDNQVDKKK